MGKSMWLRARRWLWSTTALVLLVQGRASAQNFEVQSGKRGCESMLTTTMEGACRSLSVAKDRYCALPTDCDVDRQERTIAQYKEAQKRLDDAALADADKGRQKDTIDQLKREIDERRATASAGIGIAKGCVEAREVVQKGFATASQMTDDARRGALREREALVAQLQDAQKKRDDAKVKRDADPNDSSARSDWEREAEAVRRVEKQLETFNDTYGKDIDRHADRLLQQYRDEAQSHQKPLEEAKSRVQNCEKVASLSY
jgi:hypothetical protein